MEIVKKKRKLK